MNVVSRFWFDVVPAERLAMLRVLVGGYALVYLVVRSVHLMSYGDADPALFDPVGVATVLPRPLLPIVVKGLVVLTIALAVPFAFGIRYRITAPIFTVALLWVLTYSNSFGKILHTDNALMLHVAILAVAPAADALSVDSRGGETPSPHGRYGWAIRLMCFAGGLVYLLAGIAKLKNSGFEFVDGVTLRNYVAFDNVRKLELGSAYSPLGAVLLPYPSLFAAMAWLSLMLELTAPVAAVHRRFGMVWAVLVWGFHVGVLALMAIAFIYQLLFIAFACFFPVEKVLMWGPVRRLCQRLTPSQRPPEAPGSG